MTEGYQSSCVKQQRCQGIKKIKGEQTLVSAFWHCRGEALRDAVRGNPNLCINRSGDGYCPRAVRRATLSSNGARG